MKRLLVVVLLVLAGCDAVEESLQGQAAPLKEPELPNCSRVLTCCANLDARRLMPQSVRDACEGITTPTDRVITTYQQSRAEIAANQSTSAETKAQLTAELRTKTQGSMEPACRCLLEETVGLVSLDDFLSPADCETVTTSGALPDGATCDEIEKNVTDPDAN